MNLRAWPSFIKSGVRLHRDDSCDRQKVKFTWWGIVAVLHLTGRYTNVCLMLCAVSLAACVCVCVCWIVHASLHLGSNTPEPPSHYQSMLSASPLWSPLVTYWDWDAAQMTEWEHSWYSPVIYTLLAILHIFPFKVTEKKFTLQANLHVIMHISLSDVMMHPLLENASLLGSYSLIYLQFKLFIKFK